MRQGPRLKSRRRPGSSTSRSPACDEPKGILGSRKREYRITGSGAFPNRRTTGPGRAKMRRPLGGDHLEHLEPLRVKYLSNYLILQIFVCEKKMLKAR